MFSLLRVIYKPLMLTLVLMLICGLAYPVLMTGLGQAFFPDQASGSLVSVNGQAVGSRLVGQNFTDPRFMKKDMEAFLEANPDIKKEDIPTDLLTAPGSGLEPYISPAAAAVQIPALAKATNLSENHLKDIVKKHTRGKFLGVFGGETVNVLLVNLDIAKELGLLVGKQ